MTNLIQSAEKGGRKAMQQLYEGNKQKVYYLSKCLLGQDGTALEAASYVFKNIWEDILSHRLYTEEDFSRAVLQKAVNYCKKSVSRSDPKAFRLPHNRNFLIDGAAAAEKKSDKAETALLCKLPSLQRFILVLHTVGGFSPEQIAGVFKFDMKTVGMALDAEKINIERLIRASGDQHSYESIASELCHAEYETETPAALDACIEKVIDSIAAPIEKRKKKRTTLIGISVVTGILLITGIVLVAGYSSAGKKTEDNNSQTASGTTEQTVVSEPVIDLDESLTYYADINIADYGTVTVKLDQNAAPVTVSNFVNLAQNGFYDGLTFHRIIEGFMMQGGDPNGDGSGGNTDENGNEINIVGEFTDNGYDNSLSHTRGAISMARASDYNSASSQFFIVHEDSSDSLDGQYAVFGYVTEGMDIVDSICESAEPTDSNGTIDADAQPVISSVTIRTE